MARRIGYARGSTEDQNLAIQKRALEKDGCAIVFKEKRTGAKRNDRAQLELALKVLTAGDTLVVTRLDRLGRSLRDLANIVHEIEADARYPFLHQARVLTGRQASAIATTCKQELAGLATGRSKVSVDRHPRLFGQLEPDRPPGLRSVL
jgi:hypothetical protein